jgi:AraC-like DNA-binding protein
MTKRLTARYEDPDAYAGTLKTARCRSTVTKAGRFLGCVVSAELDRVRVCSGKANLPRITLVEPLAGSVVAAFIPGFTSGVYVGGTEVPRNALLVRGADRDHFMQTLGPGSWATISLPESVLAQAGGGREDGPRSQSRLDLIVPSAHSMQRLRRLHAVATAQELCPDDAGGPVFGRGLENGLVDALADCLTSSRYAAYSIKTDCHELVMRRFDRLLQDSPQRCLRIGEVCASIKTSARMLRAACREHLGMGPKRFLDLRRLHLVRRVLMSSDGNRTTVTNVALDHDFWELGRFAGAYKALFGELPSATLHHAEGARRGQARSGTGLRLPAGQGRVQQGHQSHDLLDDSNGEGRADPEQKDTVHPLERAKHLPVRSGLDP